MKSLRHSIFIRVIRGSGNKSVETREKRGVSQLKKLEESTQRRSTKRMIPKSKRLSFLAGLLLSQSVSALFIRPNHHFGSFCPARRATSLFSTTTETASSEGSASMIDKKMPDTLVVGGGLAGLATAAALRRIANIDAVHVVEARGDTLANESAGAAIQLGPNAFKALKAFGGDELVDKICEAGSVLEENLILLPGGAPPMAIPNTAEAETGYPIVLVRWGVLRKLLGELLPTESLSFDTGSGIVGYVMDEDEKTAEPVDKEGETVATGSSKAPQLIVGADGLNSVFRDRVQTQTRIPQNDSDSKSPLKDNGRVNIKAVVPVELKELGKPYSREGATFAQFDQQVAGFAGPSGAGYTYWAISVADDSESGSRFLSDIDGDNKLAAKNLLLDKLEASSSEAVDRKWLISLVERTDPGVILINRSLEASVEEGDSFVSKDGRVVLVGDAAHAMNPAYGQSASFAFEDAATLASLLKESKGGLAKTLQDYSDKRIGRCREMQRRSEERAAKVMRGEEVEDVSKWIYAWEL